MTFVCNIVFGILCIQTPIGGTTTVTNEDQGLYIRDSVAFVGFGEKKWSVGWGRNMEWPVVQHIDATRMQKACIGGVCRSYWRKCDDALHPKNCTFVIDGGGGWPAQFSIEAGSEDALKSALENVGINASTPIPFSAMDKEGEGTEPPVITEKSSQPPL